MKKTKITDNLLKTIDRVHHIATSLHSSIHPQALQLAPVPLKEQSSGTGMSAGAKKLKK